MAKRYWLMKTEPSVYSIDDLKRDKSTCWDGVRNYQARNFMRDDMQVGDEVLVYHSNADPPGVAGVAKISKAGYPDHSAFDKKDSHYDPKSDPDNPRWIMVDIAHVETFANLVPLETLKATKALEDMLVVQRGQRLSVQPVEAKHFKAVCKLGRDK